MRLPVKKEEPKRSVFPAKQVEIVSPDKILEKRATGEITGQEGLQMLQHYIRATFPQERIVGMIDDLCKASDRRATKDGDIYETPNWLARDKGLERVFRLLSLGDGSTGKNQAPTKMVFNIISNSPVSVEKTEGGGK